MNADLDIKVGVTRKLRLDAERFRPSRTDTSAFHWETDLENHVALLPTIATAVYTDITASRGRGEETATHISVRLDNPTHPTPAKGVVPLAKGHRDMAFADGDIATANDIQIALASAIDLLKSGAKY